MKVTAFTGFPLRSGDKGDSDRMLSLNAIIRYDVIRVGKLSVYPESPTDIFYLDMCLTLAHLKEVARVPSHLTAGTRLACSVGE